MNKDTFLIFFGRGFWNTLNGRQYLIVRHLLYDKLTMEEPVMASEASRDSAWAKAEEDHPVWVKKGFIVIPEEAYKYSLQGVNSVKHKGIIGFHLIKIIIQK